MIGFVLANRIIKCSHLGIIKKLVIINHKFIIHLIEPLEQCFG